MTIRERLQRGLLRCACGQKAVAMACGGVCARCLAWEKAARARSKYDDPNAKYADKFSAPDCGRRTFIPRS